MNRFIDGLLIFTLIGTPALAGPANPEAHVRKIILSTRHLGAHGMGYNTESLWQLSKRLSPADISVLIILASGGSDIRIGAQFALASQCEPAIEPIRRTASQKIAFRDLSAEDALRLMSEFEGCNAEARQKAFSALADVQRMIQEEHAPFGHQAK